MHGLRATAVGLCPASCGNCPAEDLFGNLVQEGGRKRNDAQGPSRTANTIRSTSSPVCAVADSLAQKVSTGRIAPPSRKATSS